MRTVTRRSCFDCLLRRRTWLGGRPPSVRRRYVLLRKRRAFPEEELLHLFDQKLLRLRRPRLQAIFVQKHLLAVDPLGPRRLRHVLVDFLSKLRVERGLIEPFHLFFVANAKHRVRHRSRKPPRSIVGDEPTSFVRPVLTRYARCMCGRFARRSTQKLIANWFGVPLEEMPVFGPTFNAAPQSMQPIVRLGRDTGSREFLLARWGLVPNWAKDQKVGFSMINARAEDLLSKPAFREAFKKRRCLVPADAFYEWQQVDAK